MNPSKHRENMPDAQTPESLGQGHSTQPISQPYPGQSWPRTQPRYSHASPPYRGQPPRANPPTSGFEAAYDQSTHNYQESEHAKHRSHAVSNQERFVMDQMMQQEEEQYHARYYQNHAPVQRDYYRGQEGGQTYQGAALEMEPMAYQQMPRRGLPDSLRHTYDQLDYQGAPPDRSRLGWRHLTNEGANPRNNSSA